MSSLVLDSLEIQNYRAFRHLQINHLGRVNLIVGRNNVGKTCLLEALMLYAHRGYPIYIWEMLRDRNELRRSETKRFRPSPDEIEERSLALKNLFFGRQDIKENNEPIKIGSPAQDDQLSISVRWYTTSENEDGIEELKPVKLGRLAVTENPVPRIVIRFGNNVAGVRYSLTADSSSSLSLSRFKYKQLHCVYTSAGGLDPTSVGAFWDNAVVSNTQEDILAVLRVIAPQVQSINLISNQGRDGERVAVVKVPDTDSAIPLRSMGEGMNRLFGIACALVNARDGLLLLDEIDTGVHYTVLPDLWRLIIEVARRLNVQVFATSHSWDCIQAFQQAADENKKEEGVLIRLQNKGGDVVPVLFDEEELNIVTRDMIEVR